MQNLMAEQEIRLTQILRAPETRFQSRRAAFDQVRRPSLLMEKKNK
jgi:hypothetical protein